MSKFASGMPVWLAALSVLILLTPAGCIKNDIPYPRIPQLILAIAADGQQKEAYIDSLAYEVELYLDETTDIRNVRFLQYKISSGGVSNPDLAAGSYDLSSPLHVVLSRYQDYDWTVTAHQDITRYFEVAGEIGESVIDAAAHRVIVHVPEGTDLSKLTLTRIKLGPEGITTMTPDIRPGQIDLSYPLRVEVTAHGRTEIWTIYVEYAVSIVSTVKVDAWSKVIWAYGNGPADAENGFEYRKEGSYEWIPVPKEYVTQTQGAFSCFIPHLEPLTTYTVRSVSGREGGNEMTVTTQGTADIPDGDFEYWHQTSNTMWCPWPADGPAWWDTGNGGSITLRQNLTVPSDHTPTGTGKSAKCETRYVALFGIGKLGSGSIFTGTYKGTDGTNGILGFGRPWNLRPTSLKGYYQYSAAEINYVSSEFASLKGQPDTCHIYVALTDWTEPFEIRTKPSNRVLFNKDADYIIGYGELVYSGKMDSYKPFEIQIKYKDTSRIPSYVQITCSASKYGDYFTGGAGSVLYVDQFSFGWDMP